MHKLRDLFRLAWGSALLLALGCGSGESNGTARQLGETGYWPQWRGPGGMGVSPERGLPTVWSGDSANIRWKVQIAGRGNSSPIATDGRVILTTALSDTEDLELLHRVVMALDLETGEQLWQTPIFASVREKKHRSNSYAAPTAVTDGEHVWAYFGSHLTRLDLDGEVLWTREIDPSYRNVTIYGASSSPVLAGDSIIILQDREGGRRPDKPDDNGWIAAFDKNTGEELWRAEWDQGTCCTYSTPLVHDTPSGQRLFVAFSFYVAEFDIETGERLWHERYEMAQMVSSPVASGDLLGVSGGAHNRRGSTTLRLSGNGKATKRELVWRNPRSSPHTSSPLLMDGLMYTVTTKGVVTCWEFETGEVVWRKRLPCGHYAASLVGGDGKVYAVSSRGETSVVAARREYKVLAECNEFGESGSNASPAIAGGCLLIRTKDHLYCVEGETESRIAGG